MKAIDGFVAGLRPSRNPGGVALPMTDDEKRLLKAKADKAEYEVRQLRREYVKRSTVKRRAAAMVAAVGAALDGLVASLPAALAAADPAQWSDVLKARFDAMREGFAREP